MDPEQATMTAKPAEYQPVPTAGINANYPVSLANYMVCMTSVNLDL